jgi:accessory gene regulator protein AgrB
MITGIASRIADNIAIQADLVDKKGRLRYGIEIILTGSTKLVCLFGCAIILGVFLEMLMLSATFIILRLLSGGTHFANF